MEVEERTGVLFHINGLPAEHLHSIFASLEKKIGKYK